MTYTLDVWYHHDTNRSKPEPVRTESELEALLTYLLTHEQPHPAQIAGQGLPTIGRRNRPDRLFKLDVSHHAPVGALLYMGPGPAVDMTEKAPDFVLTDPASERTTVVEVKSGAWVTRAAEPIEDAPALYIDKATGAEFPRDATLPISLVLQALLEFQETGQRPTCVDWQQTAIV
ncbi:Imm1 family immunity protein [Lentzea sp. E54]|uniref:Imm1 family immunity protein n=1 Tax=Lentzea xerophila TaxID=3435883 RepID=UPI003DA6A2AC